MDEEKNINQISIKYPSRKGVMYNQILIHEFYIAL